MNTTEFNKLINAKNKSFKDYPNNSAFVSKLKKVVNMLRFKGYYSK